MGYYTQLDIKERELLYQMKQTKISVKDIAKKLKRHKSTIYRELRRNVNANDPFYLPDRAQNRAAQRVNRPGLKIKRNPEIKNYIIDRLKDLWSPETISGRIKKLGFPVLVSCEAIYQFIYSNEGKQLALYQCLSKARPKRGQIVGRTPRGKILGQVSIDERSEEANNRTEFGHYEGDLIINKHSMSRNIAVIIERKSRFVQLTYNKSKQSILVMKNIFDKIVRMPRPARKSITFDNGKEFAKHNLLGAIGMNVYFCYPHSPWQKGAVERVNRTIRRYLPKKINLTRVTLNDLKTIQNKINNMPRKCLNFMTPIEVFNDNLVALQH